jgi:outer membrane protein assembly factor BamB
MIVNHGSDNIYVATECDAVRAHLICEDGGDVWLGSGATCSDTKPSNTDDPTPFWTTTFAASGTGYNRPTGGYTHDEDGANYERAIFHVAGDHKLYAMKVSTGEVVWNVTMGGSGTVYSSPVVTPDGDVVAGAVTGVLYSIRPDGKIRWSAKVGTDMRSDPLVLVTQEEPSVRYLIYAAAGGAPTYQQRLIVYGQDGSRLWTSQFPVGQIGSFAARRMADDGRMVITSGLLPFTKTVESSGGSLSVEPSAIRPLSTLPTTAFPSFREVVSASETRRTSTPSRTVPRSSPRLPMTSA